ERRICFYGHTHEQRVFEVDGDRVLQLPTKRPAPLREDCVYFINPGSIDASRKRSQKAAEFAIFDSDALVVEFFSVPYDEALTEAKATAGGYRLSPWTDRLYEFQRRFVGPRQRDSEVA